MFTRVVEVTTKSGKAKELTSIINDKALPILKKQAGFVDETLLVSDPEPDRVLALSFWNSREDAERYNREQYPAIHEMVTARPRTESPPAKPPNEPECKRRAPWLAFFLQFDNFSLPAFFPG